MTSLRTLHVVLLLTLVALAAGCGGGGAGSPGGGTQPPPPPPPPQLTITTTSLPLGLVGTPYAAQLTASNGTAPLTWSVWPWMPSGLTLSNSGQIAGSPTYAMCNTSLAVTVTDSSTPPKTATANLPYNVAGMHVGLDQGQIGVYYYEVMQFNCGTEPISWSLISGNVPPGLSMNPFPGADAQLTFQGTPTQAGSFPLTVKVQDGSSRTSQATATIVILPAALKITDGYMNLGVVNQPFNHYVPTSGGTPPYHFAISAGSLPAGIQVDAASGVISGTPTAAGYSQFNVKVTDVTTPTPFTFEKPYTMLVTPAALQERNDSLADATPIYPGAYIASLSPYTDSAGTPAPDQDHYVLTGSVGDIYEIGAGNSYAFWPAAGNPGVMTAPTDPAIEILDSAGTRMAVCNDPLADNPPTGTPIVKAAGNFTDPCVNHGGYFGDAGGAHLTLRLPADQSFYIHVFDFYGRARPDFIYSLSVTKTQQ